MFVFTDNGCNYRRDYTKVCSALNRAQEKKDNDAAVGIIRKLSKTDLFFLMYFILGIETINRPWIVDRIREVEDQFDRTHNLWPRGHYKSTVLSYGYIIQRILRNPEERIGIFSETRQIAKGFGLRIKTTLESNMLLQGAFPDVLYDNPERQSPRWSIDDGLTVVRNGVFAESTVECWGLDGLPTGKHYTVIVVDDPVSQASVNTPEAMAKLENTYKLLSGLESEKCERANAGTIYHFGDLNQKLADSGEWFVRRYPAEVDGVPVLLDKEKLDQLRRDMGSWVYNCQMMLSPLSKDNQPFNIEWLKYYATRPTDVNIAIFVDPADAKRKNSDSTVMLVIGVDSLRNYFLLDAVRDKLKLTERWEKLRDLVKKWSCRNVNYEVTGQGRIDVQYYKEQMSQEACFFQIHELKNTKQSKQQRVISSLQPIFEDGRFFLPHAIIYYDHEEVRHDLIHDFITDEFLRFPYSVHDDFIDCMAQIKNPDAKLIVPSHVVPAMQRKAWNPLSSELATGMSFMGA